MATQNSINSTDPIGISQGGTNASSFGTSNGIVVYNGTSLVNYAGPQISSSGVYTNTSQPAFFAYLASNDTNTTGNSATYTLGTNVAFTTSFDQASNFNTNGTFTAPVTGTYAFNVGVGVSNLAVGMTAMFINLVVGAATNRVLLCNPVAIQNLSTSELITSSFIIQGLTATNTVTVTVQIIGGVGNTATINGSSNRDTFFGGYLIC